MLFVGVSMEIVGASVVVGAELLLELLELLEELLDELLLVELLELLDELLELLLVNATVNPVVAVRVISDAESLTFTTT